MSIGNFVNQSKIFVSKECEHQIRLMDIYDEDNFFYSSFKKAALAISGVVECTCQYYKRYPENTSDLDMFTLMNYPNNIVSFCAQRGQGKSSAMFSMADALRKINYDKAGRIGEFWNHKDVNVLNVPDSNPVLNSRFELLDPIDPTLMEPKDSIVRTIISKMFRAVNKKWDVLCHSQRFLNNDRKVNKIKDDLVEKFLECYRGLDYLNEDKDKLSASNAFDDLYRLSELGDSANFKCAFFELVSLYLQFMGTDSDDYKKAFLVIQVDDADLNTQYAYEITEELRKHCVLPNVIIMMAMHMRTMNNAIEQHFVERYQPLVEYQHDYLNVNRCHEIMEKYLDKFIPTTHRIHIPSINTTIQNEYTKLELEYVRFEGSKDDIICIDDKLWHDESPSSNYQDKLIMLIYQKTGVMLVKPEGYLHDFLPQNMRELAHFLPHLTNMENVVRVDDESGELIGTLNYIIKLCHDSIDDPKLKKRALIEVELALRNIKELEMYLLRNWSQMHLNTKQFEIIEKIQLTRHSLKNRRVTELIRAYGSDIKTREQRNVGFVTHSDVLFALYKLRHIDDPQNEYPLACAIQMYYTLYLHQIMLVGLKNWLNNSEVEPFKELVDFVGYRIFPQLYYDRVKSFKDFVPSEKDLSEINCSDVDIKISKHFIYKTQFDNIDGCGGARRYYLESVFEPNAKYESDSFCLDPLRPIVSFLDGTECLTGSNLFELTVDFLRIICNVDIQEMLYHKYFRSFDNIAPTISGSTTTNLLYDIIQGAFSEIDKSINQNLLMKQSSSIAINLFTKTSRYNPIEDTILQNELFELFVPKRDETSGKHKDSKNIGDGQGTS